MLVLALVCFSTEMQITVGDVVFDEASCLSPCIAYLLVPRVSEWRFVASSLLISLAVVGRSNGHHHNTK